MCIRDRYVLEKFAVKPPKLLSDLREQIKDVELKEVEGLTSNSSIRTAWETMRELNIHTLPVVRDGSLEGVITIGDIAKTYICLLYTSRRKTLVRSG